MLTIYISGIVVAFILLLIMAIYEKYVKNDRIDDFPAGMLMSIGSWVIAISLLICYKDLYIDIFKHWFKKS